MAKKQAWTPGPWEVGEISTPPFERGVFGRDKMAIAKIYVPLDFNKKRSEANANLIAKAPEMAALLLEILAIGFDGGDLTGKEFAEAERILKEAGVTD